MRRKVAVFADCSGNELLSGVMLGIEKVAREKDIDLFYFVSFAFWENIELDNAGERAIYNLPRLEDFDGVLLLTFSINSESNCEKLRKWVLEKNVKAVTLDYNLDGIPGIETDNEIGTYYLAKHLVEKHGVRKVIYLAGFDGEENSQRLAGINRALAEVGEKVDDEHVFKCSWSYYKAYEKILDYVKNGGELPDAIMAGSDLMGIGACAALESLEISVPEDIIVTGYDHIKSSDEYMPSISTVDRNMSALGSSGMKKLIKLMDGKKVPYREKVKSKMHIAESCGCSHGGRYNRKRNRVIKDYFRDSMKRMEFDRQIWMLNRSVRKVNTEDDFMDYMKFLVSNTIDVTSEKQIICLTDKYFASVDPQVTLTDDISYDETTCVYIDKHVGKPIVKKLKRHELLPFDETTSKKSHFYVFTPLHDLDKFYGYVVYIDSTELIMSGKLISWDGTINQVLGRAHESLKIELMNRQIVKASLIDAVSGLYNRKGFNDIAIPMIMQNCANNIMSALVMVDIDRMKVINDRFGHLMGDMAIATVGQVISTVLPKGWIGIRYGGDEFILAGTCSAEADMLEMEIQLQDVLSDMIESKSINFPLTISIGGTLVFPDEIEDIERCVKLADDTMYEMKMNKKEQLRNWEEEH